MGKNERNGRPGARPQECDASGIRKGHAAGRNDKKTSAFHTEVKFGETGASFCTRSLSAASEAVWPGRGEEAHQPLQLHHKILLPQASCHPQVPVCRVCGCGKVPGLGKGGNLGGLEGADKHCQALAQAAGAGDRTWRAYLSTQGATYTEANVVHARDRIGSGPWFNAKGEKIYHAPWSRHYAKTKVDPSKGERGFAVRPRRRQPDGGHRTNRQQ